MNMVSIEINEETDQKLKERFGIQKMHLFSINYDDAIIKLLEGGIQTVEVPVEVEKVVEKEVEVVKEVDILGKKKLVKKDIDAIIEILSDNQKKYVVEVLAPPAEED